MGAQRETWLHVSCVIFPSREASYNVDLTTRATLPYIESVTILLPGNKPSLAHVAFHLYVDFNPLDNLR